MTVFNPTPGGGTSNGVTFTITAANPVPTLTSLSVPPRPQPVALAFTLTVNGYQLHQRLRGPLERC